MVWMVWPTSHSWLPSPRLDTRQRGTAMDGTGRRKKDASKVVSHVVHSIPCVACSGCRCPRRQRSSRGEHPPGHPDGAWPENAGDLDARAAAALGGAECHDL